MIQREPSAEIFIAAFAQAKDGEDVFKAFQDALGEVIVLLRVFLWAARDNGLRGDFERLEQ